MQGYSGYSIIDSDFSIKDSANLDAFSRLRISNPLPLFTAQFTYDLKETIFEKITNGTGATVTHDTTNRCALMTFASTPTGGKSYMQSYEYLPYQPGKSQLVFITFNMIEGIADTLKFAGLSDGVNGFEFQLNGTTKQFVIYSGSGNGTQTTAQSSWNIDKLDGTGPSGLTLDISKTQILIIDFQALYVGRVRMGFDIDGKIIYAHEFKHSNIIQFPYIQTANLPVRCGMTSTGTVSTTMRFICSSVTSEGGADDINNFGYTFQQASGAVSVTTSPTHVLSLRPKLTFNGITNRARVTYIDAEIFNAGNFSVYWQLVIGQAITGTTTFNDVNTSYSTVEYNSLGTISGSPAIVIDGGWVPASGSANGVSNTVVSSRYPITLDAAGSHRLNGTLSLILTSTSGTQTCYGAVKFREIR
jgi:hypothetical protein